MYYLVVCNKIPFLYLVSIDESKVEGVPLTLSHQVTESLRGWRDLQLDDVRNSSLGPVSPRQL